MIGCPGRHRYRVLAGYGRLGGLADHRQIAVAEDAVGLGHVGAQHVGVALGQTAGDQHALARPRGPHAHHGLYRFLLGILDEPAGVDDDQLGIGSAGRLAPAAGLEPGGHLLSIDLVLCATVVVYVE